MVDSVDGVDTVDGVDGVLLSANFLFLEKDFFQISVFVSPLICYLHSRNSPHSENGPTTRRSCGGRNCGMQIGKGGPGGKPMKNLQFVAK